MNDDSFKNLRTEEHDKHERNEAQESKQGIEEGLPRDPDADFEHKGYYIKPTSSREQPSGQDADQVAPQEAERRYEEAVRRPWQFFPAAWLFLGICALGLFAYLGFANLSTQQQENRAAQYHLRMIEERQANITEEAARQRAAQDRNETLLDEQRRELSGIRDQLAGIQATLQEWIDLVREQLTLWQQARSEGT